jgi:hypothetical protein
MIPIFDTSRQVLISRERKCKHMYAAIMSGSKQDSGSEKMIFYRYSLFTVLVFRSPKVFSFVLHVCVMYTVSPPLDCLFS